MEFTNLKYIHMTVILYQPHYLGLPFGIQQRRSIWIISCESSKSWSSQSHRSSWEIASMSSFMLLIRCPYPSAVLESEMAANSNSVATSKRTLSLIKSLMKLHPIPISQRVYLLSPFKLVADSFDQISSCDMESLWRLRLKISNLISRSLI